ncbi:MAG: hypothetical protein KJ077_25685 [Anaerolineae bacterium]|nr:hypothetical protein [Anaerolineae bacterium]
MSYNHSSLLDRYDWWASLKHGGLLVAPAKLAEFFPEHVEPLPRYLADRLRRDVTRLQNGDDSHLGALLDTVLEEVLALDKAWWLKGPVVDSRWSQRAVTGETIKPRRVWQNEGGTILPVFTTDGMPGGAVARIGVGRGRRAVSRVTEWLRKANQKIGLLTNGRQWRLIHAGADYEAWCEWDIDFWFEEGRPGPQVEALRILLGREALDSLHPGPRSKGEETQPRLLTAIQASRQGQAELSSVLGERVRQAVELLIHESAQNIDQLLTKSPHPNPLPEGEGVNAPSLSEGEGWGGGSSTISPNDIYIAATRVIMRCVIILFAEARELLPIVNPRYHQSYGIQGLREQLDRRAGGHPERLRHSYSAWPRLLALFRLVYFGSDHSDLAVPRYGGGLFAPGAVQADDPVQRVLTAFETVDPCPSDAAVYRMLGLLTHSQVKVRQGRSATWVEAPVDFSDLSSEYIGILYEGLLDFELRRAGADEPMLFLNLGDQPVLALSRLEAMDDPALAALVEKFGKPARGEAEAESEEDEEAAGDEAVEDEAEEPGSEGAEEIMEEAPAPAQAEAWGEDDDETAQIHGRALAWAKRAVVAGKLVTPPRGRSQEAQAGYEQTVSQTAGRLIGRIILPGDWFLVRWGGTRKGSGTFYTRPQLAVPTVRRTLEPLVYEIVNDELSMVNSEVKNSPFTIHHSPLTPRSPADILSLKIADPSMGSGSFLIAALRYLTEALYESLHVHGHIEAHGAGAMCRLPDGRETNSTLVETLPLPPDHPDFEIRLKARLKRHVVERCLYGLDLNPLAVELARLTLWVETMDRSLPFDFLDHKLKCGNALVGCWFDRFRDYPVMAWEREGGDKNHTRFAHHYREVTKNGKTTRKGDVWTEAIKEKKNELVKPEMVQWLQMTAGQKAMEFTVNGRSPDELHLRQQQTLADMHSLGVTEPERKADLYHRQVLNNADRQQLKLAFDTWCALWFWPGDQLEYAPLPRNFFDPSPAAREIIVGLTTRYRFFHWELEFPDVFVAANSGFDAIIGNPPWDILKPNSQEFFSNVDPLYRGYGKQEALQHQISYFENNSNIEDEWLAYNAYFKSLSNWNKYTALPFGNNEERGSKFSFTRLKRENDALHTFWQKRHRNWRQYSSPDHPFLYQGSADINSYKMFIELTLSITRQNGRVGLILPSGVHNDLGSLELRKRWLPSLDVLIKFDNERRIFQGLEHNSKFDVLVIQINTQTPLSKMAFFAWRDANILDDLDSYLIEVDEEYVRTVSPTSISIPELRSEKDKEIIWSLYQNGQILPSEWRVFREFDLTNDSRLFAREGEMPVYQGGMIWLHDHRYNYFDKEKRNFVRGKLEDVDLRYYYPLQPKYWTTREAYEKKFGDRILQGKLLCDFYRIAYRIQSSRSNQRTFIATIIPPGCGTGNSLATLIHDDYVETLILVSIFSSFTHDFNVRTKITSNINSFYVPQFAIPKIDRNSLPAKRLVTNTLRRERLNISKMRKSVT